MKKENIPFHVGKMFAEMLIGSYVCRLRSNLIDIFGRPTIQEELANLGWESEEELLGFEFSFVFNQTDGSKKTFIYSYSDLIDSVDDFDDVASLEEHLNIEYNNLRRDLRSEYLHSLMLMG